MENKEEDEKEKGRKGRRILEGETWQAMSCTGSSDALATVIRHKQSLHRRLLWLLLLLLLLFLKPLTWNFGMLPNLLLTCCSRTTAV